MEKMVFATTGEARQAFPARRFHVLAAPMLAEATANLRVAATVVPIKPRTEMTYWSVQQDGWTLTKAALCALADGAGIRFGHTRICYDPDRSPMATLIARRQTSPGHWTEMPGTYGLNREERRRALEQAIAEAERDADFDPDELKRMKEELPARISAMERFGEQMAETGAILRPIRAMLGIKHAYTATELRKPFVVMRLEVVADEEAVRIAQQVVGVSMSDLFGGEEAPRPDPTVVTLAQALLDRVAPPPPREEDSGPSGVQEYEGQRITLRNKILAEAAGKGIGDREVARRAREETGKTFWRLTAAELQQCWARWFDGQGGQAAEVRRSKGTGTWFYPDVPAEEVAQ